MNPETENIVDPSQSGSVPRIVRHWDRLHWAVEMRSKSCKPDGMLIGVAWHKIIPSAYDGEPSRCLLFKTRKQARAWCVEATCKHAKHSQDWRFRPVRVREMILPNKHGLQQARYALNAISQ